MAKKTTKSGLLSKLGKAGREAHEAHKNDETNFGGGGELPEGIENGIAKLVDIKFDTYKNGDNAGEIYFMASGVVLLPKKHGGIKVEGRRTQIGPEPICETPNRSRKTVEDHLAWVYNELRKLGLETGDIDFDDLEDSVAALKESAPTFSFRTWKGEATKEFPNPRVNHQWGGLADLDEESEDDDVEDESEEVADVEEEEEEEEAPAKPAAKAKKAKKAPEPEPEEEEEEDESEEEEEEAEEEEQSLEELGEAADGDDEDAQRVLQARAKAAGISIKLVKNADSWAEVASMIAEKEAPEEEEEEAEEEEEEEEEYTPTKGEVVSYKPPKSKKAVECEVTAVLVKSQTVTLKNLDDGAVYKSVAWTAVSPAE